MKAKKINRLVLNKSTISHLDMSYMGVVRGGSGLECLKTENPTEPTDSCPDVTCHKCFTEDIWCEPTGTMC